MRDLEILHLIFLVNPLNFLSTLHIFFLGGGSILSTKDGDIINIMRKYLQDMKKTRVKI